jgi:hypothetical protein
MKMRTNDQAIDLLERSARKKKTKKEKALTSILSRGERPWERGGESGAFAAGQATFAGARSFTCAASPEKRVRAAQSDH